MGNGPTFMTSIQRRGGGLEIWHSKKNKKTPIQRCRPPIKRCRPGGWGGPVGNFLERHKCMVPKAIINKISRINKKTKLEKGKAV